MKTAIFLPLSGPTSTDATELVEEEEQEPPTAAAVITDNAIHTEDTPLNPEKNTSRRQLQQLQTPSIPMQDPRQQQQRRSSSSSSSNSQRRRRRSTLAERFFQGVVQRAFSIEEPYDPAALEENDDEESDIDGLCHDTMQYNYNSSSSSPCISWDRACAFILVLVGMVAFVMAFLVATGRRVTIFPLVSSESCNIDINDDNPILALKPSATLEGLSHGAVASDHPVCSQVGTDILQQLGGNAVDAAVATLLCLGVANPASSGLGGGAFFLIRAKRSHFETKHPTDFPEFIDARDSSDDNEHQQQQEWMTEVVDCRETAPERSSRDMYEGLPNNASAIGPLAIAVPGELRGMELAHARHGKLAWADVVEPALRLARDGVAVGEHLASDIDGALTRWLPSQHQDMFRGLVGFLTRDGNQEHYLRQGEILKNPILAKTLAQVAEHGADALYKGENAQTLVNEVQNAGGILTVQDMEGYKATLRSPVQAQVGGYTLVGVPPPSSGGAVIIGAARFLAGYKTPFAATAETLSVHRTVEAMRHAFSIRMSLSDPAFNSNVTKDAVNDLTRGDYMESLRRITKDNATLSLSQYGGKKWAQMTEDDVSEEVVDAHEGDRARRRQRRRLSRRLARPFGYLDDFGTSHLSVVDKEGNAVAVTSSVNGIFGSWIFSETTGVLLGNTMDDFGVPGRSNFFGLKASEANFIAPGKKPLSSMSPTMVFRQQEGKYAFDESTNWGELMLVLGGSGGPKIITAVLQVLLNFAFVGMPLFESMARPRVHDQLVYHDSVVTATEKDKLEQGPVLEVSRRTKDALSKRGHSLLDIDYTGCVQAISVDPETATFTAVSDIRKQGSPAGY